MALVVDLQITAGSGEAQALLPIERMVILRLEELEDRNNPDDEIHQYFVERSRKAEDSWEVVQATEVSHRYGDGAWRLTAKALAELGGREVEGEVIT